MDQHKPGRADRVIAESERLRAKIESVAADLKDLSVELLEAARILMAEADTTSDPGGGNGEGT